MKDKQLNPVLQKEHAEELKEHNKRVQELHEKYPNIPTEIFDIEASEEMVDLYQQQFGV